MQSNKKAILGLAIAANLSSIQINGQSTFDQAVMAANAGNHEEAIKIYEDLIAADQVSSELYYNLGLSHLESGDIASSVLQLERATKLSPGNEQIRQALDIASDQVAVQITEIPDFILWQWYTVIARWGSSDFWSIFQIIFLAMALYSVYVSLFQSKNKRWMIATAAMFGLAVFSFINADFIKSDITNGNAAIITAPAAYIYEGADDRSEPISDVSPGVKVFIIDQIGEWYKVQLEDKDVGWIETKKVTII